MVDIDNDLTRRELVKRFPELGKISNPSIRQGTIDAFLNFCPDYFWKVPGSSSGKYHPKDHREDSGLWLHTKRAFTVYERLAPSYKEQGKIDEYEMDCGRSAILLHDMFKYGWPKEEHTTKDHDVVAARILDENTNLPDEIIGCVESHNGAWYSGKAPETDLEQLHHMADMCASDVNIPSIAVTNPNDELMKQFGESNINVCE